MSNHTMTPDIAKIAEGVTAEQKELLRAVRAHLEKEQSRG